MPQKTRRLTGQVSKDLPLPAFDQNKPSDHQIKTARPKTSSQESRRKQRPV